MISIQSEELAHMTAEEVATRLGIKLNTINPPRESMGGWGPPEPSAWYIVYQDKETQSD